MEGGVCWRFYNLSVKVFEHPEPHPNNGAARNAQYDGVNARP